MAEQHLLKVASLVIRLKLNSLASAYEAAVTGADTTVYMLCGSLYLGGILRICLKAAGVIDAGRKYANLEKYVYWLLLATIAVIPLQQEFLRQWWQSLASVALLLRFAAP
ncbi:MAG: hypothetical protein ACLR2G_08795 [Phascolarctobacterium faecium]